MPVSWKIWSWAGVPWCSIPTNCHEKPSFVFKVIVQVHTWTWVRTPYL